MALFDFLDPARAKVLERLKNLDKVPTPNEIPNSAGARFINGERGTVDLGETAARTGQASTASRVPEFINDLNKPLDFNGIASKVGGVGSKVLKTVLNPTFVRAGSGAQAAFGVADAAKNGINADNATEIVSGALGVANPLLGTAANVGVYGGKGLAIVADKAGLLDRFKPAPQIETPAFLAARDKYNASLLSKGNANLQGFEPVNADKPQPLIQTDFTPAEQARINADARNTGVNQFKTSYVASDGTRTENSFNNKGSSNQSRGVGGGRSISDTVNLGSSEPSQAAAGNGVIVDRGGVVTLDNPNDLSRSLNVPGFSDEDRAANLARLLSSEAQKAYRDTTISNEEYTPVQVRDEFGNVSTEYAKRTAVTPGINIGGALQSQIGGVAPRPVDERIDAAKNAAAIEQQQIAAGATIGSARLNANANILNNDNSLDAVKAKIISNSADPAATAIKLGVGGAARKDPFLDVFKQNLKENDLSAAGREELSNWMVGNQNATGAEANSALIQILNEEAKARAK